MSCGRSGHATPVMERPSTGNRRFRVARAVGSVVVAAVVIAALPAAAEAAPGPGQVPTAHVGAADGTAGPLTPPMGTASCPWLTSAMAAGDSPAALADLVVSRMTLPEKLGELVLESSGSYENINAGVARLCIPSLTLQDGPWGLAVGDTGVTLLPSPLGIGATFDTALAEQYGQVLGSEAKGQGIDVSQGPNLNIDRVPESGRADESYGEDPLLTAEMGVADIEGIQSQGVMAEAKHAFAYQQETNRGALNDEVSPRAMQEIYLPPFKAAVTQAHVASLMCAYPQLNGTFQCQDPAVALTLAQWGFTGFVRSDLGAVHAPATALASGTDLIKPSSIQSLAGLVAKGLVSQTTIDSDVEHVLTEMFTFGIIGRPAAGVPGTPVDTAAHAAFALTAAERSAVLLRNSGNLLPLDPSKLRSLAVIGADASTHPVIQGSGSSHVTPPFVSTPLEALTARLGSGGTVVRYADGGSTTQHLATIPSQYLTPASGQGHGLTLTVGPVGNVGSSISTVDPVPAAYIEPAPTVLGPGHDDVRTNPAPDRPTRVGPSRGEDGHKVDLDPAGASGTSIQLPHGWTGSHATWTGTFTPPRSGRYTFSLAGTGSASMSLNGQPVVSDLLPHDSGTWSDSVTLTAGEPYQLALHWDPVSDATTLDIPSVLHLGMDFVGDSIAQAVSLARSSQVAVVFAADYSAETFDRPTLSLPGDQDALISAVAAANPHTIVVLNTSGPVLMPWIHQVSAVLEDWYPGEQDGAAAAALLTGDAAPTGHLPVTFPTSDQATAVSSPSQWPGTGLTATYSEGLGVGYRYDHLTDTAPLFPFGYGLTYTTFSFHDISAVPTDAGYAVTVNLTNTGHRAGTDVVQAYLTFPSSADEPPAQLAAFTPVTVAPGQTQAVTLTVPTSAFQSYQSHGWTQVAGTYRIGVGDSSAVQPLQVAVHPS